MNYEDEDSIVSDNLSKLASELTSYEPPNLGTDELTFIKDEPLKNLGTEELTIIKEEPPRESIEDIEDHTEQEYLEDTLELIEEANVLSINEEIRSVEEIPMSQDEADFKDQTDKYDMPLSQDEINHFVNLVKDDNNEAPNLSMGEIGSVVENLMTGRKFPNELVLSMASRHIQKILNFITRLKQFNELYLPDQMAMLPNVKRYLAPIHFGFYSTPLRTLSDWEKKLFQDHIQDMPGMIMMGAKQYYPPECCYQSSNHQKMVEMCIEDISRLCMDQTTFLLVNLMLFFQGDSLNYPEVVKSCQDYFKQLLFKHLRSKLGQSFVAPAFERHLKAISDINQLEELVIPDLIN